MDEPTRDHGTQPIDTLIQTWGLANADLVSASTEQLTYKQVQKARKGRELTLHMRMKLARALNVAIWNRLSAADKERFVEYCHTRLFTYNKGYKDEADPNAALIAERGS